MLLVFSTIVFVIVLGVIAVSTHFYVVCCHFMLFHGHVSYRTGPQQCLQDWKMLLSFDFFYVQNDFTFALLPFACFQVSASYSHLQCLFWEASSIRDDRSTQKTLVIMPYENIIIIIRWLSQYIFIYILWVFCVIFLSVTGFFRIPMFLVHQTRGFEVNIVYWSLVILKTGPPQWLKSTNVKIPISIQSPLVFLHSLIWSVRYRGIFNKMFHERSLRMSW